MKEKEILQEPFVQGGKLGLPVYRLSFSQLQLLKLQSSKVCSLIVKLLPQMTCLFDCFLEGIFFLFLHFTNQTLIKDTAFPILHTGGKSSQNFPPHSQGKMKQKSVSLGDVLFVKFQPFSYFLLSTPISSHLLPPPFESTAFLLSNVAFLRTAMKACFTDYTRH